MSAELVSMPKNPADLRRVAPFYPFEEGGRKFLFVVENTAFVEADEPAWALQELLFAQSSRVYRSDLIDALEKRFASEAAEEAVGDFERLEVLTSPQIPRVPPDLEPGGLRPLGSLVLHVAHDCNMRCGYCYADFGRYGGPEGMMTEKMAVDHLERFFDQLAPGQPVHVTFFGGEPLMNMDVVFAGHRYAKDRATKEGRPMAFGITTNGTLLTPELGTFFNDEQFTVTVSIDGPRDVNDRLRPLQTGKASYDLILEKVRSSGVKANARVTLTRQCTDVARIVRDLVGAGFVSVGVSPVASGAKRFDLDGDDLRKVLLGLEALAEDFIDWAKEGKLHPFSNIRTLVEQVGQGAARALPCGAGTGLAAADDKGRLYACHRLVGEEAFAIGSVDGGVDEERRQSLLAGLHPRGREPCQTCWARYLCGGGCHHIAWLHADKGVRPYAISEFFCDFLRAWYRLGLYTYARLGQEAPHMLDKLRGTRMGCNQA